MFILFFFNIRLFIIKIKKININYKLFFCLINGYLEKKNNIYRYGW